MKDVAPRPYNGPLFLYLTKAAFAETWIKGGQVPINPASAYLGASTTGVKTPDEVLQFGFEGKFTGTPRQIADAISIVASGHGVIEDCHFNGAHIEHAYVTDIYDDPSYIMSLSTELSNTIMTRLEKVCAVRFDSPDALKRVLDEQLGTSRSGLLTYTTGSSRGHFLRGEDSEYMKEFRFSWRRSGTEPVYVTIPPGLCELVDAD